MRTQEKLWARYVELLKTYDAGMPSDVQAWKMKALASAVAEERADAARENERVWCEAVLLAEDPRLIEKITKYVLDARARGEKEKQG